jgi:hypothetical protein
VIFVGDGYVIDDKYLRELKSLIHSVEANQEGKARMIIHEGMRKRFHDLLEEKFIAPANCD